MPYCSKKNFSDSSFREKTSEVIKCFEASNFERIIVTVFLTYF